MENLILKYFKNHAADWINETFVPDDQTDPSFSQNIKIVGTDIVISNFINTMFESKCFFFYYYFLKFFFLQYLKIK